MVDHIENLNERIKANREQRKILEDEFRDTLKTELTRVKTELKQFKEHGIEPTKINNKVLEVLINLKI